MKLGQKFYNLFYTIIAQNALNLNMNFLLLNLSQKKGLKSWHQDPMTEINKTKPKKESKKSQMQKLLDKETVRVVFVENNAYWVHNNVFYKADIDKNGRIDSENAVQIDVFSLSNKEATRLLDILDSIEKE
jgi:hypothetical protein